MTGAAALSRESYGSFVSVEVSARIVEPTPTAVVMAATTWAEFTSQWVTMLDQVWRFLRSDAPEGLHTDNS